MSKALGLLMFAALTLWFIPTAGTVDVVACIEWARNMDPLGPFAGYDHIAVMYPPLSLLSMWISLHIGDALGLSDHLAFKLPIVLFSLISAAIVLKREPSAQPALLLLLIIAPFGLLYGYYDIVYLPFLLIALYATRNDHWGLAGATLLTAALIKWQPLVLAPVFAIGAIRSPTNLIKATLPALAVAAAVLTAFGPTSLIHAFHLATGDTFLNGQGLNFGWLLTYALQAANIGGMHLQPDGAITVLVRDPSLPAIAQTMTALRIAFYCLFIVTIGIYATGQRSRHAFLMTVLTASLAQFTWNTGVHENHLFVPMVIAFVAWRENALDGALFMLIAAVALTNVAIFYGFDGSLTVPTGPARNATLVFSALEVVLFFVLLRQQIQVCLRPDARPGAPASAR